MLPLAKGRDRLFIHFFQSAMGKQQDWKKVTTIRKIVRDMKTKSVKCSRTGDMKGGVILTDETAKPYIEELAKLEAKIATEKK